MRNTCLYLFNIEKSAAWQRAMHYLCAVKFNWSSLWLNCTHLQIKMFYCPCTAWMDLAHLICCTFSNDSWDEDIWLVWALWSSPPADASSAPAAQGGKGPGRSRSAYTTSMHRVKLLTVHVQEGLPRPTQPDCKGFNSQQYRSSQVSPSLHNKHA